MKHRFLILFFIASLALPAACAAENLGDSRPQFHSPRTGAEKALDAVLLRAKTDRDLIAFALRESKEETREYSGLFTRRLLNAWRGAETSTVLRNCKGVYISGELCGLDYNPLLCAQDYSDVFDYRTISASKDAVIVEYAFANTRLSSASYKMLKTSKGWKMDGVDCGNGNVFNMR